MNDMPAIARAAELALTFKDVRKSYRIYGSLNEAVIDRLGLYSLRFWRPRPEFSEFEALRDINLTVKRGQRLGIVGRNGAGKSTLLKLVSQNFAPTEGQVTVNGSIQAIMKAGLGFHSDFTGRENARSSLLYNGLDRHAIKTALAEIEDFVELGDFFDRPVLTYSQGMVARLQFAVATAIHPDIVIIDEVLGAGDAYFSSKCAARMRKLAASGATLLIVSHGLEQIHEFCDRAIWMDAGSIMADGAPADVIDQYQRSIDQQACQHGLVTEPAMGATDDLAARKYLSKAILSREVVDVASEQETPVTLTNGGKAYRWASAGALRIVNLQEKGGSRNRAAASVGGSFNLEITVECRQPGTHCVKYVVLAYGVDGTCLAREDSPPDRFDGRAGEVRTATLSFSPVLLGSGEYLLSVGVFDANADEISPANRLDYLSRSFQLKIAETNDGDPPLLHVAADWFFGRSATAVIPALDGRI